MRKSITLAVVLLSQSLIAQSQSSGSEAALFTGIAKSLFGLTGQNPNLITQGMNTAQQFQQQAPSPISNSAAQIQIQQLSSAQSNQAAIQACVNSGLSLATCQSMNKPLTSTVRTTDDVLFETALNKSKTAGASEIVEFLDLNYVAFLMVSFSHVLASYINTLGKFDTIDPLSVIQLKPVSVQSLTSKASIPSSTTPTPLSWNAITKNIASRLPKIRFTWENYKNFIVDNSNDRGGVVLIFTNTSTKERRIVLIPHPQMKGFTKFQGITSQVAKDIGFDLPPPQA